MPNITVLEAKTEERPFFFEFTKRDLLGFNPTMVNLNYDPFPDKNMEDVVRRQILCREFVLHAKLKGEDVLLYKPGVALEINGHTFTIKHAEINFRERTSEIEGSELIGECEPMKELARIREAYATDNK